MEPDVSLGPLSAAAADATGEALALVPRINARDWTVWGEDPTELADRLGWLEAPERADEVIPELVHHAAAVREDGITDVLLVGMGGSSLYPLVLDATSGSAPGWPRLRVLDSTDPAAVLAVERELPWSATLLVPASKSGGTTETMSHLARFYERLRDAHGQSAGRYVLPITDPGSSLDARATDEGFRGVVHGQADVGGRFSALTPFGLLPAALLGMDLPAHLAAAREQLEAASSEDADRNAPFVLGAVMAAAFREGRDKFTVLLPDEIASFGLWIEQLVAESTGKHGVGLLPVVDERPGNATFGEDRLVVAIGEQPDVPALIDAGVPVVEIPWSGIEQLTGEVVRFEVATAVCGALLGINPFDQPNVQAAKLAVKEVLDTGADLPPTADATAAVEALTPGEHLVVLGYVQPDSDDETAIRSAADRLRARTGVPVTVGIGPRYLHSTGQLHKGGPANGTFLVAVGDDPEDAEVPGQDYGFSRLKRAQAAGDIVALQDAGRTVVHVSLEHLAEL
jgi:transaldolase / glucose-6-phosphate isomerase